MKRKMTDSLGGHAYQPERSLRQRLWPDWRSDFRVGKLVFLILTMLATSASTLMADGKEGPWERVDMKHGATSNSDSEQGYIAYASLGNNDWGSTSIYAWNDDDGIGYTVRGTSAANTKNAVYSIYKWTENVEPYTRVVVTWKFRVRQYSNAHNHTTALYLREGWDAVYYQNSDFTEDFSNKRNNEYCLGHISGTGAAGTQETSVITKTFEYDRREKTSSANYTRYLLLTHVIGNWGEARSGIKQWGAFRSESLNRTYYYYKYITFDANGGSGSMGEQTIENSGTLKTSTLTRDGYVFGGWNTKKDGSGTYYADKASISATASSKGNVTLYAQWLAKATDLKGEFNQKNHQVKLSWTVKSSSPNTNNGKFEIWRDGEKIKEISHTFTNKDVSLTFEDTKASASAGFPYEADVRYVVYVVPDGKSSSTSNPNTVVIVNTTRSIPVRNLEATQLDDRIVFTWTSDGYPASEGHQFKIYVDKETDPIYTITPTDNQTAFRWEHRKNSLWSERHNDVDNGVPFTEENGLDHCSTHDYRIEGVIGNKELGKASVTDKSIGQGTQFDSFDASKGIYPGEVRLTWHVQQAQTVAKTYIVERRRAEQEADPWVILHRTSSSEEYQWYNDDMPLPGVYYEYRVTVQDKCDGGEIISTTATDIGFAKTTGTISGRITYGSTGSSVAGADVIAKMTNSSSTSVRQYHHIYFDAIGAVTWTYPTTTYASETLGTADFSLQLWINPEELAEAQIIRLNGDDCYVGMDGDGELTFHTGGKTYTFAGAQLAKKAYNHVSLVRKGTSLQCFLMDADGSSLTTSDVTLADATLSLADAETFALGYFKGYADEFRLWTRALTEDQIRHNWDRLLVGNEEGLETYWTFDEGLNTQFFDYSRDGTVYNQHHGKIGSNARPSDVDLPAALQLKATTDQDGNYVINGVPFAGEGSTYAIIPSLGIHEFNPSQHLRYVGNNSLVHNSTDFDDVSSFSVSGTVRYAGTDYPVEGVNFYVDGQLCAMGGKPIATDGRGSYTISVPIGKHYITLSKMGHVFENEGRFPADPEGVNVLELFEDTRSNVDFSDITLVPVGGRVVGGNIEEAKPLGFGTSVCNIGQATITLETDYHMNVERQQEGLTVQYVSVQADAEVSSPTDDVKSVTVRQGSGQDNNSDLTKNIIIKTDPATGEFAALLPPVNYRIKSVSIPSNTDITFSIEGTLDASDPLTTYTDSLENDKGEMMYFKYVDKFITAYHAQPELEVTQQGNTDGSYGESVYTLASDNVNPAQEVTLYTVADNVVTYNYGYPIFEQLKDYTFKVRGYERYVNNDVASSPVAYDVPLKDVQVTFSNQMGAAQPVVINASLTDDADDKNGDLAGEPSETVVLNEKGEATYKWKAGFPNITEPYTRDLAATYVHNNETYTWKGVNGGDNAKVLRGIVIGALPSGSNFVTAGPDLVEMIIRDPGGTASSAYWEKGQSVTTTHSHDITFTDQNQVLTHTEFGFDLTTITAAGVGVIQGVIIDNSEKTTLDVGVRTEYGYVDNKTTEHTVTATRRISTSGEQEYVGAQGDVFIGESTNIVFGNARSVGFKRNGANGVTLEMFNNYVTSQIFETHFNYTQNHIENVLIPNLIDLRNQLLTVVEQSVYDNPPENTDNEKGLYLTTLAPDDDDFGAPGTYKIVKPKNLTLIERLTYVDRVKYYNEQVKNWESWLGFNERMKVEAIAKSDTYKSGNYSFDTGTIVEESLEVDEAFSKSHEHTFSTTILAGGGFDTEIFGQTVDFDIQNEIASGGVWTTTTDTVRTTVTGFTLAEAGDDDALSIDVYKAPDGYGAIFFTRGGQTSCPYEGEQRTKYYDPGKHVLATATMQIENPKIAVQNGANIVGNVPAGGMASYVLLLTNESETTEDCYFNIHIIDETNVNHAGFDLNSNELGAGRTVLVPAGGTVRMNLQLEQTDPSILDYENIAVVLASTCQDDPTSTWDVIGDTVLISAHFVPTSTDVVLHIDNPVVNTTTKGILPLRVSDFDPNFNGLKYIAVQYQGVGDTDWTTARRYVLHQADVKDTDVDVLLEAAGGINFNFDMTSFPDRTYRFRALSATAYGTDDVTAASEVITVVKDMVSPQPLGLPQPTDGILTAGEEISVTFNEDIRTGDLSKDANFFITGVLNGSMLEHTTALQMNAGNKEVARTNVDIPLAGKAFSLDMWVKISGEGTLLTHGSKSGAIAIGTDAEQKLCVDLDPYAFTGSSQKLTSDDALPLNKWIFLSLSMTEDGKLTAAYASDAATVTLFNKRKVADVYQGNGPLTVGGGAQALMHELLLWDEERDIIEALAQRSLTKAPSTRHLIGYWKMNEGEGTSIRDYARNRHMTMATETWNWEFPNKAANVTTTTGALAISTTEIPASVDDNYAVELWMKAPAQTGDSQVLQLGEIGLWMNDSGKLMFTPAAGTTDIEVGAPALKDGNWHHIAINRLAVGSTSVYVDGERYASVATSAVGDMGSDCLLIGVRRTYTFGQPDVYDRQLTATIDEVRIWKKVLTGDELAKNRKKRLTGKEAGLVAYYPFETATLDQYNQIVTVGSTADLTGSAHQAAYHKTGDISFCDEAPTLQRKPEETNVAFAFTSSSNKIVINIAEELKKIEGTTLNFVVRDVHDQNGNNLYNPVGWSAFVSMNPLAWADDELALTTHVTNGGDLTTSLINKSGKEQTWTLTGMPSWLTASAEYGTTAPLGQQDICFTVSPATPIGNYSETVYVTGNDGIPTLLVLNIKVVGDEPDWSVDANAYETSMNIIATISGVDGKQKYNPDDLLGAFIGEECRGVAHPVYNSRYDNYFVTMAIFGNATDHKQEVKFRYFDASTGTLCPCIETYKPNQAAPEAILFEAPKLVGTYAAPLRFVLTDKIEQATELKTGWNWISLYVVNDDMKVSTLFGSIASDVITVKNQMSYTDYDDTGWHGGLSSVLNTEMIAVKMKNTRKLRLEGSKVTNGVINIAPGWNWVGYYTPTVYSVNEAMVGFNAAEGDMVKSQWGISYFDSHEWTGDLTTMEPGRGYQVFAGSAKTFSYAAGGGSTPSPALRAPESNGSEQKNFFSPVDYRLYPDNATMTAQLLVDGEPARGIELAVFAGDECRTATVSDADGYVYLTIPGDEACEISFKVAVNGQAVDLMKRVGFEKDAIYGTYREPFVFDLSGVTGIDNVLGANASDSIYDLQGRKMETQDAWQLEKGVYIVGGKKMIK